MAAEPTTLRVDDLTLTRVLYADVLVPPEIAGLSVEDLRRVPWRAPLWATDDELGASASAWVVDVPTARIVLDPLQAADHVLHAEEAGDAHVDAFIELMEKSGFPIDDRRSCRDLAHRDDRNDRSSRRRALEATVSERAHCRLRRRARRPSRHKPPTVRHRTAWRQLIDDGYVDTYRDGDEIVAGMTVERTGAHNPGHCVFHFGAEPALTWLGHLAVSPLHLATGPCPQQHPEPERAWELLRSYRDDGRLLTGPSAWPLDPEGSRTVWHRHDEASPTVVTLTTSLRVPARDPWFNPIAEFLGPAYLRNAFTLGTEQEVAFLVELLGLEPGMRVLDAGCGPGRHALALARRGINVVGVDLSPDFIALAREAAADLPAEFHVQDVRDLVVRLGVRRRAVPVSGRLRAAWAAATTKIASSSGSHAPSLRAVGSRSARSRRTS